MKLGVFDSGLGGLSVIGRLRQALPQADIFFYSDQARLPYGDRELPELAEFLRENVAVLARLGVDAIVMGCNTTCAVAAELGWPELDIPIFDLLDAGAEGAQLCGAKSFAVTATAATVRTSAYTQAIRRRMLEARVAEEAAPELVPLIEARASATVIDQAVQRVMARFGDGYEAIVLGCSHYPLIAESFARVAPQAHLIDPADVQARRVLAYAQKHGLESQGSGTLCAWTNADAAAFEKTVMGLGLRLSGIRFAKPELWAISL